MSKPSSKQWPKPYLLGLYHAAIEHGYVWAQPIAEADAISLRQSFYRLRRRSDNNDFITPEMEMVSVGEWQAGDGSGRLPFIYSKLPDGNALPQIIAASGEELAQMQQPTPPLLLPEPVAVEIEAAEADLSPDDITSFVDQMRQRAALRMLDND